MAKRSKASPQLSAPIATPAAVVHPPAKSPTLLAASIVLFALWFVFLLVVAIWH
jgi:hypothetical protein